MILFEFGEDSLHKGLAEKGGTVVHLETAAILLQGGHLPVVETDDLPVAPDQRGFLAVQIIRVDDRSLSFALTTQSGFNCYANLRKVCDKAGIILYL